jgi:protein-tyrosine phosphatase
MGQLPTLHVANAHFVTEQLLVGGDLDFRSRLRAAQQLLELYDAGVTHIVDVRLEWSDQDWAVELLPGLQYLHHGVDDAGQAVPAEWFRTGVDYAVAAIESGGVVLTHCHMGVNRGPSLGFAVLLGLGWDAVEALDAIRSARPVAFMAYAEDALRWHHRDPDDLERDLRRLVEWREVHGLDVGTVIRLKREQGE